MLSQRRRKEKEGAFWAGAGYNDCAERNPARLHRAAPLRGDYTQARL